MAESRIKKVSRGSVTLQAMLAPHLATKKFAEKMGKGTDLVSRWATGDRQPTPPDRATLEDETGIPWRAWDDLLDEEQAAALTLELQGAAVEPAPPFPSDAPPAAGGTGHAA